jgi:ABC-type transport system involved in multi-copper enzyme maturation permease subunit
MIELIKLELRKSDQFGLPLKLFSFMTLIVLIILYSYLQSPPLPEFVLNTYENMLVLLLSVVNVGYMIYMAVLLRRVVLHEYSNRTISQLFLYPISRIKLLSAKVILVCLWSFCAMVVSGALIYSLLLGLDAWLHFALGEMNWTIYLALLGQILRHALAATLIGLLPFGIALWRKSGDLLVTIAVMLSVVIYSNDGTRVLADQPMLQVGLALLGIAATSYSLYRASQEDVFNI